MTKFTRKSAAERKAEILSAALPLFAARGFAATTTREIATAARVSDALLYKYFPSKEQMYRDLVAHCVSHVEVMGARLEALPKTTLSFVRAVYFLMYVVRFGGPGAEAPNRFLDQLLLQDLLGDGAMIRAFHRERVAPWVEKLQAYYLAALAAGDAHGDEASAANRLWLAEQLAFILQLQALPGQNTVSFRGPERRVFEDAVVFALRGLGLTQAALAKHYHAADLYEFVQTVFGGA